jgi:hypothetical protein
VARAARGEKVNWRASVRTTVGKLLEVGCWLAPGPICQKALGIALIASAAGGLLGVLMYVLVGR